jgi:hypothetical protein
MIAYRQIPAQHHAAIRAHAGDLQATIRIGR